MERYYLLNTVNAVGRPFIEAELASERAISAVRAEDEPLSEDACALMFPEALAAWKAGDDSAQVEDEDLMAISQARDQMENERRWAMSLDEFLEDCAKNGMDLDAEIGGRELMTYWWRMGQDRT